MKGSRADKRRKARASAKAHKAASFKRDGGQSKYAQKRAQQARGNFRPTSPFYSPNDPEILLTGVVPSMVVPKSRWPLAKLLFELTDELDELERQGRDPRRQRRYPGVHFQNH